MGSEYDPTMGDYEFEHSVHVFVAHGEEDDPETIAQRIHNDDEPLPRGLVARVRRCLKSLLRRGLLKEVTVLRGRSSDD